MIQGNKWRHGRDQLGAAGHELIARRAPLDPAVGSTIASQLPPGDRRSRNRDTSGLAAAAQSRHHMTVEFLNAPAGMRSGLKAANGPADLEIRTEFAMTGPG